MHILNKKAMSNSQRQPKKHFSK